MFKVAIVEDDYMVSMLNRSFTEKDKRFQVVKEFTSGKKAMSWLLSHPVDLVILDVYMPLMTGADLLHELRVRGSKVDVIVVTAAHETNTLNDLLKLGIVDYLVKPFTVQRFQQALDGFCQQRAALEGKDRVNQSDIDKLLYVAPAKKAIPKGLQEKTLEKIRAEIFQTEGQTCEAIAVKAGLSVVTARRYLNYMLDNGEAESRINYDTGGRPCVVYWALNKLEKQ
jgi:response regulator of citrate/malate metabolism